MSLVNLSPSVTQPDFNFFEVMLRGIKGGPLIWGPQATEVVTGTGVTTSTEDRIYLGTGTTVASTAGRYNSNALQIITGTGTSNNSINWGKKHLFIFTLKLAATSADCTWRMHFTQATTIVALAAHGLGIKIINLALSLVTYGTGGSETAVAGSTLTLARNYHIVIEHDPATADRLYLNGALDATQSTAANIPSTEPDVTYNVFFSVARSGTDATDRDGRLWNTLAYREE